MGRRPRPEPFNQGHIKEIYELMIAPLIFFKPVQKSINEWMAELFDFSNRDITRYKVIRPFTMPGLLYRAPYVKVQGIGYRRVTLGSILWVRTDARAPDIVDVEFLGGKGKKDQVFCLSQSEWNSIRANLHEAEREKKK